MRGRRILVILALALIVGLAAIFAARKVGDARFKSARARFEQSAGSLDLTGLALPRIERDRNAAAWLQAGAAAVLLSDADGRELQRLTRLPSSEWGETDDDSAGEILHKATEARSLLLKALDLEPSSLGIDQARGAQAVVPDMTPLLRVARLLLVDGRVGLRQGDGGRVAEDLGVLAALGRVTAVESVLLTQIVSLAADGFFLTLLRDSLSASALDARVAQEILEGPVRRSRQAGQIRALRFEAGALAAAVGSRAGIEGLMPNGTTRDRWLGRLVLPYVGARGLDHYAEMIAGVGRTVPEERQWRASIRRPVLVPDLSATHDRLKIIETSVLLAEWSLGIYLNGLEANGQPWRRRTDPYAGGSLVVEPEVGGAVRLSAPEALRLHSEVHDRRKPPPLDWIVPPSAAATN